MISLKFLLKQGKTFTSYKQIYVAGEEGWNSYSANNAHYNSLD